VNGYVSAMSPTVGAAVAVLLVAILSCIFVVSRRASAPAVVEEAAIV